MSALADWTRSTACSMGTCVEARLIDGHVEVRDTRNPGPILHIEVDDWAAFIAGVKLGEFDVAGGDQ